MPRKVWNGRRANQEESYEAKRRLALETAARMFNERGFYKTSLDDIAAELNVTKAALYYYFENKDEILYECHSLAIRQITAQPLNEMNDHQLSGLEKIDRFVERYVGMIVQSFGRCLVLVGTQPLEPKNAAKCRAGRREINELLVGLIQEGIADSSIAPCDAKLRAYFVFGTLNWIAQWYDEKGPQSLDTIAREAVAWVRGGMTTPGARPMARRKGRGRARATARRRRTTRQGTP